MPIEGSSFEEFTTNLMQRFDDATRDVVTPCGGNYPISTELLGLDSLQRHDAFEIWLQHRDRNYYCSSGTTRYITQTHIGSFRRYCDPGYMKVVRSEDVVCVGPGLTLEEVDGAPVPTIRATLTDSPAGSFTVEFAIIDFSSASGVPVPQIEWGSIEPGRCTVAIGDTSRDTCSIRYSPSIPGTVTVSAKVAVNGVEASQQIEVRVDGQPDLESSVEVKPNKAYPQQTVATTVTVANVGEDDFDEPSEVELYLVKNRSIADDDRPLATFQVAALASAAAVERVIDVKIPDTTEMGSYSLVAVVNRSRSGKPEASYDNNLSAAKLDVKLQKIEMEICVGNPIGTNSGRKIETEVDYEGTGPFPLRFARFYSSSPGNPRGWSTSYSRHLFIRDGEGVTDVILVFDDGHRYEFRDIDHRGFSDPDLSGFLSRVAGGFEYLDESGMRHRFDASGKLISVTSLTGFTQTLAYDGERLVAVTDPFGRTLTLDYGGEQPSALRTPDGRVYRYDYDVGGLLTRAVLPDDTPESQNDNPTRTYLYESPDLHHGLTGIIDENGNRYSTFDYDEEGRAILSTHVGGADRNTIVYGEDETTVTGPLNKETTYYFEEILGTRRLTHVDGRPTASCPATSTTRTHDERGSVVRETDRNGNVTEYAYTHTGLPENQYLYHVGLVTRRTEALGTPEERTTTIQWHPEYRLPARIMLPGRVLEFSYDDHARLVRRDETAPASGARRIWRYRYDERGFLIEIDGPRDDVEDLTRLEYNDLGEVAAVIDALGHRTAVVEHDANGLPVTVRDANGVTTHLTYDVRRRVTARTIESAAGDVTTAIGYDAKGNVTEIHLADGRGLYYSYDEADRLIQIRNDLGESIEFDVDAAGNRRAEVTRGADQRIVRVQQRTFDELGRLIETIGAAGQTTRLGHDPSDNLTEVEDPLGRASTMSFDGLARLVSVTDALGGESTFTYDGRDNLMSITDANGVTTTYTYDGLSNLVEEASTASGTSRHDYDAAGNRVRTVDGNGVEMEYQYDALNRVTAKRYLASSTQNIDYRYDERAFGIGRLTTIVDPSGRTEFAYDDLGNLVTDHRVIDGLSYTTRYIYGPAGRLAEIVYPSGRIVHYALDELSRVAAITSRANGAAPEHLVADEFAYLPFGSAMRWQDGNGIETAISYDQDYRIREVDVGDRHEILSLAYEYDDVSNITGILDNLGVGTQAFGHDGLNRLIHAEGSYGTVDYTYDGAGNRLTRTVTSEDEVTAEAYRYEPDSHRIDRVTSTSDAGTGIRQFRHDGNGNIVSDVSGERSLEMVVNAGNRLAALARDRDQVGDYLYNGLGQRVAKTSTHRGRLHAHFDEGQRPIASNGKRKRASSNSNLHAHHDKMPFAERLHFHYDQFGNLIAESDGEGRPIREYIYLGSYRIAMAATRLEEGSPRPTRRGEPLQLYYVHNDHLGTPMKVTDDDQQVVWSMVQTPFGEVSLLTEAIQMPMRFPGQYADLESGFSYNYFRDYDPTLGRYIQSDPIGLAGGLNTYAWVSSRPTGSLDPLGLKDFELRFWVGGSVGHAFLGGGVYDATVTDLETGDSALYTVYAVGIGVGLPSVRSSSRPIRFSVNDPCVTVGDFEGYGYIGGASAEVGGGIQIGGGLKIPGGPLLTNSTIESSFGGVELGVSHDLTYWAR